MTGWLPTPSGMRTGLINCVALPATSGRTAPAGALTNALAAVASAASKGSFEMGLRDALIDSSAWLWRTWSDDGSRARPVAATRSAASRGTRQSSNAALPAC